MDARSPRTAAAAIVFLALVAGCGSDSGSTTDDSFGLGQPSTTVGDVATTQAPTTVASPTTSAAVADTTVAEAAPSTGPLPTPTVSLYEVGRFDKPVQVTSRPGDAVAYVVEQPGRVVAITDLSSEAVLDITDLTDANGEQGLLGLAFHPTEDLAYVDYTNGSGDTVVAEFAFDPGTGIFDVASRREVLTVDQPYRNHNGGQLAFGPDQLLYIGLGDGGSGGDPERHALDLGSRLGKILRIDPAASGGRPYTVPGDNPFVARDGALAEIYSYGLRNPWRFSFDRSTGDLSIGDVGQNEVEEIDFVRRGRGRGANFGWRPFEGRSRFAPGESAPGHVPPVITRSHGQGWCSITGGVVVRDPALTGLRGRYLFGDFCQERILSARLARASSVRGTSLRVPSLSSFGEDARGRVYATSLSGPVYRLVPR